MTINLVCWREALWFSK